MELSGADLRDPDIHLPVSIRKKRHKMAIAGHRSGLLRALEIRNCLKFCVGNRTSPKVLGALQPNACGNCHNGNYPDNNEQRLPSDVGRPLSLHRGSAGAATFRRPSGFKLSTA
jgi:hypothetical protein